MLDGTGAVLAEAELSGRGRWPGEQRLLAQLAGPAAAAVGARPDELGSATRAGTRPATLAVNGGGALMAHVPCEGALAWHMGATFERDVERLPMTIAEQADAHMHNWQRLQALVPTAAATLRPAFCARRRPARLVGRALPRKTACHRRPGGCSRPAGLWIQHRHGRAPDDDAVLCAELLAARLMERTIGPETKLARAMSTERL